jgi:outer membrane protein OmpA-like peptidoglycan-associated protein
MSQNVSRLKELLFDRESATLAELQARIDGLVVSEEVSRQELRGALEALITREANDRLQLAQRLEVVMLRAGTEEQFCSSVAEVLDGSLRQAEVKRHDQLSRAIAPLLVKTIKIELRNSQDEMVEALYPITGRLVKSYVASAMKDLMEQINRRLSGGSNPVMLRVRSLFTGRPVAELALAEAQRLEVAELFLIRRGAGELVQHWPDRSQSAGGAGSNSDIHLSGVLTAINDFAAQALKDDGGNLRAFELDDFQMYLRASPAYLLAAKCRGKPPPGIGTTLDDEFLLLIERNRKLLASPADGPPALLLAPFAARLQDRLDERHRAIAAEAGLGFNPLKAIAYVAAVPLLGYLGWSLYSNYETARVRDIASGAIAEQPALAGYPTQIDVANRGQEVTLTGLVPTAAAKSGLVEKLRVRLPSSSISDRLTVLPNHVAELEPQIARVRRELAGIEGEAVRGAVRRSLVRAERRLEQAMPHLHRLDLSLSDVAARPIVTAAAASVESATAELKKLQAQIADGPLDVTRLAALSAPMHALAERLQRASLDLSTLFERGAMRGDLAHGNAAPVDALESAEELSLSVEQLATVAIAVAQSSAVKAPPPPAPTPRERLEAWFRTNALFFGDNAEFRDPQAAQASLDAVARLMRDARVLVRVVGYTDERGGQPRNVSLSHVRAQHVVDALADRGVPRAMLVAVGRPVGGDISPTVGPQSPNRRVEFEIGFDGEAVAQP